MIKLEDYRIIDFESLLKGEDYAERQTFLWLNYLKSLDDFRTVNLSFETIIQELRDTDSLKQVLNQKNERRVDQTTFNLFCRSKHSGINYNAPHVLKKMQHLKHIIVDKSTIDQQDAIFQSANVNGKGSHDNIKDLDSLKKELLILLNIIGEVALKKLNRPLDYYNLVDRIERDSFHQALFEAYEIFYLDNPPKSASVQLPISKAIRLIETEQLQQILKASHEHAKYNEYVRVKKSLEKAKAKGDLKIQSINTKNEEVISALINGISDLIDHYEFFEQNNRPNPYIGEEEFVRNYSDMILKHIAQPSISPRFDFSGNAKDNNVLMKLKKNQCVAVASIFLLLGVGGVPDLDQTWNEPYSDLVMSWARKSFGW